MLLIRLLNRKDLSKYTSRQTCSLDNKETHAHFALDYKNDQFSFLPVRAILPENVTNKPVLVEVEFMHFFLQIEKQTHCFDTLLMSPLIFN